MKFFVWVFMSIGTIYALVLEGPVSLKHQSYEDLTVYGDAFLDHVTTANLEVYGKLTANVLESDTIVVQGGMSVSGVKAKKLELIGDGSIDHSQLGELHALSNISVNTLTVNKLYLYKKPPSALTALKAREVIVNMPNSVSIKVGDASYIDVIKFIGSTGVVLMSKDRSYVADVQNGSIQ